jgi:putative glutamine transport system substrate-binding protein
MKASIYFRATILCACLTAVTGSLSAQFQSGDSWEIAKTRKTATVTAAFLQEDAFAYIDASGKPAGIEIDIFEQFKNWLKNAKGVNLTVNYVAEPNFQKFYTGVQKSGKGVVGLGTVTILERRKTEVQFAPPFINNIALLVTHSSVPELDKLDNMSAIFKEKKAVVAKGTTLETYMSEIRAKYHPNMKIETVASQMDVVKKVAEDPSYICYIDLSIYWPAYDKEKLPIKRHAAGDLSSETFGFITPIGSDWNEPLTEFFNHGSGYRANHVYKAILMKHLGAEVTKMLQIAQSKEAKAN